MGELWEWEGVYNEFEYVVYQYVKLCDVQASDYRSQKGKKLIKTMFSISSTLKLLYCRGGLQVCTYPHIATTIATFIKELVNSI